MIELNWLSAVGGVADPGAGNVQFNNSVWTLVTQIAVSTADRFANNIGPWLDSLDLSTNPIKANFRLQHGTVPAKWIEFNVSDVVIASATHRTLVVTLRGQGNAFTNLDIVGVEASSNGDQGPPGTPGTNGTNGTNGLDGITPAPQFIFSVNTDTALNVGEIRFNSATPSLATKMYVDNTDRFGNDRAAFINLFDDSINTDYRSIITLYKQGAEGTYFAWKCTGPVTLVSGIYEVPGTLHAAATVVPAHLDKVGVDLFQAGGKGDTGTAGTPGAAGSTGAAGTPFDPATMTGTSSTSLAVGTGSKAFVTQTGKVWGIGQRLRASSPDGSLVMEGAVTNYTSGTGALTINVDFTKGTGTFNTWYFTITGERGDKGLVGDQGAAGAQGIQGLTGPQGTAGTNGTNGTNGADANVALLLGTSTTSLLIEPGYKVFVTQTNKAWTNGMRLRAASPDGAKVMEGAISEYYPVTGNLTIAVDFVLGEGTHNLWNIAIAGERGLIGDQGIQGPEGARGTGLAFNASGTLAQRAAYDLQPQGFVYLQTDVAPFTLFVKESATSGDWSPGTQIETPTTLDELVPTGALQLAPYLPVLATATTDLGGYTSNLITLGGTGVITSFGIAAEGVTRLVRLNGTPTITYSPTTLIVPGSANIACLPDDSFLTVSRGGGVWQILYYQRAAAAGASVELDDILPIGALKYAAAITVASAGTVDLGAQNSQFVDISGAVTIGGFGSAVAGTYRHVRLTGAPLITHSAALVLPGAASIQGAAGDIFFAQSLGAGNWVVRYYQRASGQSIAARATTTDVLTGTDTVKAVSADALASLWEKGTPVAAAALVTLGEGNLFHITGVATITDIDFAIPKDGRGAWLIFDTAGVVVTHNATTLVLPGAASITTNAGDRGYFVQDAADNVICLLWQYSGVSPVFYATPAHVLGGVNTLGAATPDAIAGLWEKNTVVVTAAANIVLGEGGYFHINGATPISDVDWAVVKDGRWAWCYFETAGQLLHSGTLQLPGNANITVGIGDRALFIQDSGDTVLCAVYIRADGKSVIDPNELVGVLTVTSNPVTDANAVPDGGFQQWDLATPFTNSPWAGEAATGFQLARAASRKVQIAFDTTITANGSRRMAVRSMGNDGVWQAWVSYAGLDSPTFTGIPAVPTAAAGTNTTQAASTAFVAALGALKANLASPALTGTPTAPTATAGDSSTAIATTAFVTTADNLKAPLASPALTGVPTAPTAAALTSTTQLATTAFVTAADAASLATVAETLAGTLATKGATPLSVAALWKKGTTLAAAALLNLGDGGWFRISGATGPVTDIDFATASLDGRWAWLLFETAGLVLTHNATTLNLPGNANITTLAGDIALFIQDAADNVYCASYMRSDGKSIVAVTKADVGLSAVDNTSDATKNTAVATLTSKTLTSPVINGGTINNATIANGTFSGTVTGIDKTTVGLGNVDNTSDAAKPVSTAQQTALNLKANLASPALTGVPTAPTAANGTNTTQVATTQFVETEAILKYDKTGGTISGSVTIATGNLTISRSDAALTTVISQSGAFTNYIYQDAPAGQERGIRWRSAALERWRARVTNTAESTGNVGSDWELLRFDDAGVSLGVALGARRSDGAMVLGAPSGSYKVANSINATGGFYENGVAVSVPAGLICAFAGVTAPGGWLFCYGQLVSRTTYSLLYAAIGTTWGIGDGTTTFGLPDLRGRVIAGQDDMGGTSANRLTGVGGSVNGDTLGAYGGGETHILLAAELPAHAHTADPASATSGTQVGTHTHTFSDTSNGRSAAHVHTIAVSDPPYQDRTNVAGSGSTKAADLTGTGAILTLTGSSVAETTDHTHIIGGTTTTETGTHTHAINIASFNTGNGPGLSTAFETVQPTAIANYIIFTGV